MSNTIDSLQLQSKSLQWIFLVRSDFLKMTQISHWFLLTSHFTRPEELKITIFEMRPLQSGVKHNSWRKSCVENKGEQKSIPLFIKSVKREQHSMQNLKWLRKFRLEKKRLRPLLTLAQGSKSSHIKPMGFSSEYYLSTYY